MCEYVHFKSIECGVGSTRPDSYAMFPLLQDLNHLVDLNEPAESLDIAVLSSRKRVTGFREEGAVRQAE
jgi:hypothetical protein